MSLHCLYESFQTRQPTRCKHILLPSPDEKAPEYGERRTQTNPPDQEETNVRGKTAH